MGLTAVDTEVVRDCLMVATVMAAVTTRGLRKIGGHDNDGCHGHGSDRGSIHRSSSARELDGLEVWESSCVGSSVGGWSVPG